MIKTQKYNVTALVLATILTLPVIAAPSSRYVESKVWEQVAPYLLPDKLPIKQQLDTFFASQRVTLSIDSMKKAGFIDPTPRKWTRLIVTKHPAFPGYVFKLYLDAQRYHKNKPEHLQWIGRIEGVRTLATIIEEKGWGSTFKTPQKWIYPLPENPSPPKHLIRKHFILVEEDMEILDRKSNHAFWKGKEIDYDTLEKLYYILETAGLHDSKPDNIPFSIDGRLAFIDTQQVHAWPVLYKKISTHLSPEMLEYWKLLIKNSRKK